MKKTWVLLLCWLLAACSSRQQNFENIDTTNLGELQSIKVESRGTFWSRRATAGLGNLRHKALKDSAMSVGAQGALAWSSQKINKRLEKNSKYLDTIYNFSGMMLSHGVIPPVLEEGNNALNLADPDTIRVADKMYKIVLQARFATTPPNWREYLLLPFLKPELPHGTLLPKDDEEQKVWRRAVCLGWEKGIEQANAIFEQNLARLRRDYKGMALYRKLLQQRMISPPFVSRTELGITGDGNNMRINDQVLRIVEHPQLQTSGTEWRAIVVPNHD